MAPQLAGAGEEYTGVVHLGREGRAPSLNSGTAAAAPGVGTAPTLVRTVPRAFSSTADGEPRLPVPLQLASRSAAASGGPPRRSH